MGVNLKDTNKNFESPLAVAVSGSDKTIVKKLIEAGGCDVNSLIVNPLNYAIRNEDKDMVDLLLASGLPVYTGYDINRGTNNLPPLIMAIKVKNIDLIQTILKAGAPINERYSEKIAEYVGANNSESPLSLAIKTGDIRIFKTIIEAGADVNLCIEKKSHYQSPLIVAVNSGDFEMVNELLKLGAKQNLKKPYKTDTPLIRSIVMRRDDIFELLLANEADVNEPTHYAESALDLAVDKKESNMVKKLVKARACGNMANCLNLALENNDIELFREILKLNGSNHIDKSSESVFKNISSNEIKGYALVAAINQDKIDFVREAIELGADINQTYHGKLPIEEADRLINKKISKELIDCGAIRPKLENGSKNDDVGLIDKIIGLRDSIFGVSHKNEVKNN